MLWLCAASCAASARTEQHLVRHRNWLAGLVDKSGMREQVCCGLGAPGRMFPGTYPASLMYVREMPRHDVDQRY
jgi:hypothetical protein